MDDRSRREALFPGEIGRHCERSEATQTILDHALGCFLAALLAKTKGGYRFYADLTNHSSDFAVTTIGRKAFLYRVADREAVVLRVMDYPNTRVKIVSTYFVW